MHATSSLHVQLQLQTYRPDEDFENGIPKPEYRGDGQKKMWQWIHEHCRHHQLYRSNEFLPDGQINFKYISSDEELLAKWLALESGKRIFLLRGEMRRIGILKKAKLKAERQSPNPNSL